VADDALAHGLLLASAWQRFWRLEVPFAMPGLIWNMMMSMSGGWFFVVASEAISVGDFQIALPGAGSTPSRRAWSAEKASRSTRA
jgi:NitT/TauT family transport system permease protein